MTPFVLHRPATLAAATRLAAEGAMVYAGGTTALDLMKKGVLRPDRVVDITAADAPAMRAVERDGDTLCLGALVTMHEAAQHPLVKELAPCVSQSLWLAASHQIHHMATLGGNVLQRTRDPYFRDPDWLELAPGNHTTDDTPNNTTAARRDRVSQPTRLSAVLGTTDTHTASYPGDFAQSLAALGADVQVQGPGGARTLPFETLHVLPAEQASVGRRLRLRPGEIITGFRVPVGAMSRNSLYLKARDRQSYAFANASVAAALALDGDRVRDVRVALGGVATVPWRSRAAEDAVRGRRLDADAARAAGHAAFAEAVAHPATAFKIPLGRALVAQALLRLAGKEIDQ